MSILDLAAVSERRADRLKKIALHVHRDGEDGSIDSDYMSHQNVHAILEQATFIAKAVSEHVDSGHHMDDWLEDKISKVADDMDEIYKYLKYGKE